MRKERARHKLIVKPHYWQLQAAHAQQNTERVTQLLETILARYNPSLTPKQVGELTGLNVSTLRKYEHLGLMQAAERTEGNHRRWRLSTIIDFMLERIGT